MLSKMKISMLYYRTHNQVLFKTFTKTGATEVFRK